MTDWTEHFVDLPNGRTRVKTRGTGPAAIWSHGAFIPMDVEDRSAIRAAIESLEDWRVVRYDARGLGGSAPGSTEEAHGATACAEDVIAIADALGIERFMPCGLSRGVAVSLEVARLAPDRVFAMALILPPRAPNLAAIADAVTEDTFSAFLDRGEQAVASGSAPEANRRLWRDMLDNLRAMDPAVAIPLFRGWAKFNPTVSDDELREMDVPVHIWACKADPGHPWAQAERLTELFPQGTLSELEDLDDPLASMGEFRAWLDRTRKALASS